LPSLRPMLYAAKRTGAFDTRGLNENDKSSIDLMLISLQAKQLGLSDISGEKAEHRDSEASSNNVAVGLAQAVNMQRREDKRKESLKGALYQPGGNQDSNSTNSNASHISTGTGGSYQSRRSRSAAASRDGSHNISS